MNFLKEMTIYIFYYALMKDKMVTVNFVHKKHLAERYK